MSAPLTPKSTGGSGVGPRSMDVSAWPGAPGAGSGGMDGPAVPIASGVVGDNDFLEGGHGGDADDGTLAQAFPGYDGQTWQAMGSDEREVNPSTQTDPGHVSGGIRTSSPAAFFPGLGQGV